MKLQKSEFTFFIKNPIFTIPLPWGVTAFGEVNTELLKFFSHEGFDFKQGTEEMYDEALVYAKSMESWPQLGAIVDMGEFILVNFGV